MATNFSDEQLNLARKKFYGRFYYTGKKFNILNVSINKILIYFLNLKISLINFKRKIFRLKNLFNRNSNIISPEFKINIDDTTFLKHSDELKNNNYTYIENFLDNDYYEHLLKNWPNINFFNHNTQIIKFYSLGFKYSKKNNEKFDKDIYFSLNTELKKFYQNILSEDFKNFINKLLKFENVNYSIYTIASTMAKNNSYLIPHIDGVRYKSTEKNTYNFIYFVDGNDNDTSLSGGTGIYRDNNFKEPLLIPKSLKNSVLIYNSSAKFFHGFKVMSVPKNVYRKTVNFQFFSENM